MWPHLGCTACAVARLPYEEDIRRAKTATARVDELEQRIATTSAFVDQLVAHHDIHPLRADEIKAVLLNGG